ncbi:MAG: lipocalin-like domain-containing protein [Proteobacteria bacterium]|nr:lipocalin-like domain-containing protein [Pseudomonadota bacterium]
MRQLWLSILLVAALASSARAAPPTEQSIVGSWRLISLQSIVEGEEASPRQPFGDHPFGRLVITADHHMMAYIAKPDRKPPAGPADAAALLQSMIAYTGKFDIEGDKFTTTVDGAWNEVFKSQKQVRYFVVAGDRLTIRTGGETGVIPGKKTVGVLVWEREH